jgi:hypothetical protein
MYLTGAMARISRILSLGLLLALRPASADQSPLRYRFEIGQQFIYERRTLVSPLTGDAPARQTTEQIQAWCLRRDGPEFLILLQLSGGTDGRPEPARGALLFLDETGRRRIPVEIAPRMGPLDPALDVLPMLPVVVQNVTAWTTPYDLYQRQWRCDNQGPDTDHAGNVRVEFTEEDASRVAEVLGQTRAGRFWFDPVAGCVTRLELQEQDQTAQTRTQVVAVLRPLASHTPAWTARRAEEAERFLRTLRHEDRLLAEVVNHSDDLAQTLGQLDRLWKTFASDVQAEVASPFAALAEARRQSLGSGADMLRARATLARRWLNQPARPWSLQNASGQTVTSEALRQGVVIECFWSAESVWGLRALPSLRRLPRDPLASPPRVISYNMDFNVAVAKRAIERCGQGLTNVLGGPLQDAEALPEFPVVRVLDRNGVIRGLWFGWDENYAAASELARQLAR